MGTCEGGQGVLEVRSVRRWSPDIRGSAEPKALSAKMG